MGQEMFLRKIPEDMRPWECNVNGVKYVYPAGTEQNVPAEVAALIDAYWEKQEVDYPETGISFNDLRDKPFCESTEVLFDQRVEFQDIGGMMAHMVAFPEFLEADRTYTVTYNGVAYSCQPFDLEDSGFANALGNMVVAGGDDTGEPFILIINDEEGDGVVDLLIFPLDGSTSATVKIEKSVIHTIDPKFGTAFRVNVWYNGSAYVADKTCAEIREAERKKYPIVGTYTNMAGKVYTMIGCDDSSADLVRLAAFDVGSIDLVVYSICIIEGGEVGVNVTRHTGTNTDEV